MGSNMKVVVDEHSREQSRSKKSEVSKSCLEQS
jgi:hypothetical protein